MFRKCVRTGACKSSPIITRIALVIACIFGAKTRPGGRKPSFRSQRPRKLPAEVLSQIFTCLRTAEVPTRDYPLEDTWGTFNESLATGNLVCRYRGHAATGAKDLWTHIATLDAPDLRRLRLMFELFIKRSSSFPLSLTVPRTDNWEHYFFTFNTMEPHVHRL